MAVPEFKWIEPPRAAFARWRENLSAFERGILALTVAWALSMISLPILRWVVGENVLPLGISVGVLLQLGAVRAILAWAWGARRAWLVTVVIVVIAWLIDYVGHTSGILLGKYAYTALLQPQLGDVPLLIPFAWLMMLPPAWAVARRITAHRVGFVLVSALAFTAWDLFLDPQMVGWNLWTWEKPVGYFGIPWLNFVGWLAASAGITLVARRLAPLDELPARPLIAIYAITWALETIGLLFFWGLPGPALVGGAVMGLILLLALRRR